MALTSLAYVEQAMRDNNFVCWIVKSDNQTLGKNNDKEIDLERSIQAMKDCVNNQTGGILTVNISCLTGKEKNQGGSLVDKNFSYSVRAKEAAPIGSNSETMDNTTIAGLYETIAKQKYENEIATLKAKIVELEEELENGEEEEEGNSIIAGIFKEVQPYIKPMIGKFLGGAMPLQTPSSPIGNIDNEPAPGEQQKATEEQKEQRIKCANGANRILKVDEYFGDRVLQLAWLVENDKASYDMACNLLNGMAAKLQ